MSQIKSSIGSASRRASTERRKTKKNFFSVFMRTNLSAALPERIKTKKTYFCDFNADSPFPRVDYTERRKIMRKNVKCPRSKFMRIYLFMESFLREKKD